MSNYEKQYFEPGQILTAEQLNHIEDGIEKILPAIEAGNEKQLVTDAEGNLAWIDTTHSVKTEEIYLAKDFVVPGQACFINVSGHFDENSEYFIIVDGETIPHQSILLENGYVYVLFSSSYTSEFLMFNNNSQIIFTTTTLINKSITIKVINSTYTKINKKFLPINSGVGEGAGSSIINTGSTEKADGQLSTAINRGNAMGDNSLACNYATTKGESSFAQGELTVATGYCQAVFGYYNIEDEEAELDAINRNSHAIIVGNGRYDNELGKMVPSNAHTLDWSGNGWFAGGLKVGGAGQDDEAAQEVALKSDINQLAQEIQDSKITDDYINQLIDAKMATIINVAEVSY